MKWLSRSLLVGAALAAALVPLPARFVERWYSRGLYQELQPPVTALASLVRVSLLDIAAGLLAAAALAVFARRWGRAGPAAAFRSAAVGLVLIGAAGYLWFLALWGLNYRRVPLEDKLAFESSRVTRQAALEFGRLAVARVNALQPVAATVTFNQEALAYSFAAVETALGTNWHALLASPKRSVLMWYFQRAAIDGMTNPFFLEIILNPDLLPFERPFVLAHEWAHLAGYADESEANFVAWLACISSSPQAQYSGWLSAYVHITSSLPREDRLALRSLLSPAVIADLVAARERLARSTPLVRVAAREAYDTYLRANRIDEGIASYNAVVRLMLGTRFGSSWAPELRAKEGF